MPPRSRSPASGSRITIRDVAQAAEVSVGTVSNVLTGQRHVSAGTRAIVEAAVARLGYVPDVTAQALIGRRGRAVPAVPQDAPRLCCVGYVCSDDIAQVDDTPARGSRTIATAITRKLGGRAANVAVAAAGLGPPLEIAVELVSVLGQDAESDWAVATLASRRVALAPETRRGASSLSRAIILLQRDGLRTILNEPLQVAPASLAAVAARMRAGDTPSAIFVQGDQVAGLTDALRDAPPDCRIVTQVSAADAAADPQGWRGRFALFDMAILTAEAAQTLYGPAGTEADLMRRVGAGAGAHCPIVALTLGAQGAVLFLQGRDVVRVPAPPVPVLDETGAGDAFAGALLTCWLHGLDPATALAAGVAAGARAVTQLGAQEHGVRAADLPVPTGASAPDRTPVWAVGGPVRVAEAP